MLPDVVCVGGGVIGLLTAVELAELGQRILVVDQGALGRQASWAGAGIIAPASLQHGRSPYDRLRGYSFETFPVLAARLRDLTGIDVGFCQTGGVECAHGDAEINNLLAMTARWRELGIEFQKVVAAETCGLNFTLPTKDWHAWFLPGMSQLRNPWYLKALIAACRLRNVELLPNHAVHGFYRSGSRVTAMVLADGTTRSCGVVAVTAGAWSGALGAELGITIPVKPIRGQILLLRTPPGSLRRIVIHGKRYLVPRADGLVLVGSTEEEVGFAAVTTESALQELHAFATGLAPVLNSATVEHSWAGLRPGTMLGSPIIGLAPGFDNVWIGTGHFREGIQLSPGTARLLADWITQRESFEPVGSFALDADRSDHLRPFQS